MILTDLTLQQFRSYEKRTFSFSPETTCIIGPNSAGKTNILEAIMLLTTGKSFRADRDQEVIQWESEVAAVSGNLDEGESEILELRISRNGKRFLVNGVPRRQIDFIGNLRAVFFWPEHLELVTGSPGRRRAYMDSVLVQVDREYRRNLLSYERGLRQRNRLLDFIREGKAHRHQLQFWDQLLMKAGGYITDARSDFVDFINHAPQFSIPFSLFYEKSVISEGRLREYADEEIAAKTTLVGPHRDDFGMTIRDLDIRKYGSRGEQRLGILWLKRAEVSFLEQKTGSRPMLLLDDIFSELDTDHRVLILDLLGKQQTIITSADPEIETFVKKHGVKLDTIRV